MNEKELVEKLRQKYSVSPPDGMTKQDVLRMSDSDLLDMDYFLNDEDDDDFGEEGFKSSDDNRLFNCARLWRVFLF